MSLAEAQLSLFISSLKVVPGKGFAKIHEIQVLILSPLVPRSVPGLV